MVKFEDLKQKYYIELQLLTGRYEQELESLYPQCSDAAMLNDIAQDLIGLQKINAWISERCQNMPYVL